LVPREDSNEKESPEEDEDDDEGTSWSGDTGASAPGIPWEDSDVDPGMGTSPAHIDPAAFHSIYDLGPGASGGRVGSTKLAGAISPGLVNVANLRVSDPETEPGLKVVIQSGSIRQIFTSLRLVDVQPSGSGFELRYYLPGAFDSEPDDLTKLYSITGDAFKTVRYLPVASTSTHAGGIRVVEIGMKGTTRTRDVVITTGDGLSYQIIDESGLHVVDGHFAFYWADGFWQRIDGINQARDGLQYTERSDIHRYLVRRNATTSDVEESALFLLSSTNYAGGGSPNITTWVPDPVHLGKVQSVTRPDGSWTAYTYYDGTETVGPYGVDHRWRGMTKEIFRPWNGSPATVPGTPSSDDCECTTFVYEFNPGDFGYEVTQQQTSLPYASSSVVSESSTKGTISLSVSSLASRLSDAGIHSAWLPDSSQVETDHQTDAEGIYTDTYTYHYPVTDPDYRWDGSLCCLLDSSGDGVAKGYQMGTYNPSTGVFTVDTTGVSTSNTHIQRISVDLFGNGITREESTREVAVTDLKGRLLRRELWIYDSGSEWSLATFTTYEYPLLWENGAVREVIEKKNGRTVRRVYQASATELHEWDEQGIETVSVVDLIGRPVSITHVGTTGQADRVTSFAYSGRVTTTTFSSDGDSLVSERTDDWLGRVISSVDERGAETVYDYDEDEPVTTVTLPGGLTRIETRNIDGRVVTVAGTSVVDTVYEYEVLSTGHIATTVRTGEIGVTPSARYVITEQDGAGRTVKKTSPSPTGTGDVDVVYSYWPYTKRVDSIASPAGTIYYWKVYGDSSLTWSGVDEDEDEALDPGSNDRVTETRDFFVEEGGYWWEVSYSKQFDTDEDDATAVTMTTKRCLHGHPDSVDEKTVRIMPTGETVTTEVTFDCDNKTRTTTESTSGISSAAVETEVNGLVKSKKGYDTTAAVTYAHDSLGRVERETTPRGAVTKYAYNADGSLHQVTDHYGQSTTYAYYGPTDESAGKVSMITNPQGKTSTYGYNELGLVEVEGGTATYKVSYEYDKYGAKWKMFTWRDASTSDVTEWGYQPGTGLLESKKDAENQSVGYKYYSSGRLAKRTWARGVWADYYYNGLGDLTSIDYSDSTPDVAFTKHDRLGRPRLVTQADFGSEVLTYMPGKSNLEARFYSGSTSGDLTIHKLLPGRGIKYSSLDSSGHSSGFLELRNVTLNASPWGVGSSTTERTISYSPDTYGRLQTITDGSESVGYTYAGNSSLIDTVENKTIGSSWFKESRYYDKPGRLVGIRSQRQGSSSAQLTSYAYDYDRLGRRVKSTFQDGSTWEYGYNDRSEVRSAKRKTAGGIEVTPLTSTYEYDGIGNRESSTSGVLGNHVYTPTSLNQYGTVTTSNSRAAIGRADGSWDIEVNGNDADEIGDIYYKALTASNGSGPVWQGVTIEDDATPPTVTKSGHFWYAKATATPHYDEDGNLLSDDRDALSSTDQGRWVYSWDAENRLTKMETTPTAVTAGMPYTKLTFEYNWEGKRIARNVWKGGTSGSPTFQSSTRWLYEGWNPVAEFSGSSDIAATGTSADPVKRYTWGLDLGDRGFPLQGAGGVGGLLLQTTVSGSVKQRPSYDGNGNIVAWTGSGDTAPIARREYDAFGNAVMSEGEWPSEVGFSTKLQDPESRLCYFGYRFYTVEHGRWLSRDPLGEDGGLNLFSFLNNGMRGGDYLGMVIQLYDVDVASLPIVDAKISAFHNAEEHPDWRFKGDCEQTFLSYVSTADDMDLVLDGDLKIALVKQPGLNANVNNNPNSKTGWTTLQHEQHHAYIDKSIFNVAARHANSYEGTYCRSCCYLARDVAIALMKYGEAVANFENNNFDNYDYGKPKDPSLALKVKVAEKELDDADAAYRSNKPKCEKY
jgi:RHS repeat-associated protein